MWNGLAMCVSSNSKRDRRPAAPGSCSEAGPAAMTREEPTRPLILKPMFPSKTRTRSLNGRTLTRGPVAPDDCAGN